MAVAPPDTPRLIDALRVASQKHRDRRRPDPHASPFINHVIDVLYLLDRVAGVSDSSTLLAALLHHAVEDGLTTPGEIESHFGASVRDLVEEVTDNRRMPKEAGRTRQLDRAASASPQARLILLTECIATLHALPAHRSRAERGDYLDHIERVGAVLRGTGTALDRLFLDSLRQARVSARELPLEPVEPETAAEGGPDTPPGADPRLQRLQQMLCDAEELADAIAASGGAVARGTSARFAPPGSVGSDLASPRLRSILDPDLRALAEPGIGAIEIRPHDSRTDMVAVDGAHGFPVPLGLSRVLSLLTSAHGPSTDGFVPFQTLRELAHRLGQLEGGKDWHTHRVTAALSRLRKVFHQRGRVNPWLIETCRRRGARLRLRWTPGRD
jgi:guanosine-3',5'-bis(diphosphate) 3'-pyrophosphohydrolase